MGSTESSLPGKTENANDSSTSAVPSPQRNSRVRATTAETHRNHRVATVLTDDDDAWWWEIENENLILDTATNVEVMRVNDTLLMNDNETLLKINENMDELPRNMTTATPITKTTSDSEIDANALTTLCAKADNLNVSAEHEQTLEEFKEELRVKRMARQTAIQDLRDEINSLRKQLSDEQSLTQRLRNGDLVEPSYGELKIATEPVVCNEVPPDADDDDPMSRGRHANIELANAQLALQMANSENISLRAELGVVHKQVLTLKEVIACCKEMIAVKEEQSTQLKAKLTEIETSFGERELKIMSDNLRHEYERQLGNIRQLRQLYEERQRISAAEHENLQRLISIKKDELLAAQDKTQNLEERNQTLVQEVENANNELASLREECNEQKFEKKALKEEMGAVNMLFSQLVMGFNGKNNLDIDRLTTMLEENRTLLNDMATKEANCSDGATLPKLLFELVEQAAVGRFSNNTSSRSTTPTFVEMTDNARHAATNDGAAGIGMADDVVKDVNTTTTDASNSDEMPKALKVKNVAIVVQDDDDATASMQEESVVDFGAVAVCQSKDVCFVTTTTPNNNNNNTITSTLRCGRKYHRRNANNNNNNNNNNNTTNKLKISPTSLITSSSYSTKEIATDDAATAAQKFHELEVIGKVTSAQEIIGNLPKVWKVLMELLSHHKIEQVQFETNGTSEDCYKSVETPNGPKAELSVSKTYIKLKDLILEKKSLVKETNRLKTLNCHLDYRLNEQEKRLSAVSLELTKTWHLVGKMQRQHRQLHTQEQILRYQLQQKRRLLSELKDELEYCRRKWAAARAKNDESQEQYNDLRREFARRKVEDANNSTESGYSDSGPGSDEEERAAAAAAVAVALATVSTSSPSSNCRKKNVKEMFEHTRKIKRMQSTSPDRANNFGGTGEIVLRWNSAPPTCGWRDEDDDDDDDSNNGNDDDNDDADDDDGVSKSSNKSEIVNRGAIPKCSERTSSSVQCLSQEEHIVPIATRAGAENENVESVQRVERACRIQRLEEQCKSLIQQVLETSDNRERLEVQLCRFQDEIAPVQYAIPLEEFINKKRLERMTRASSAPATGTLTPREEEYTRKRSERLERLEEESRQLMLRIKRTSDRGHYLRCSLDRIRRAPSREESIESNTEEEVSKIEDIAEKTVLITNDSENVNEINEPANFSSEANFLTAEEEAYTARRSARLQSLEEESRQLLTTLSNTIESGGTLSNKLDSLHERYGEEKIAPAIDIKNPDKNTTIEQRLENIEKISMNREERLRILEEEGKQLLSRLTNTSERGTRIINRIAERELNRQARSKATTPIKDDATESATDDENRLNKNKSLLNGDARLLPTPENVACSSIVTEELSACVTVTTIPSHIAAKQGAVPKSKPAAQLSASRPKAVRITIKKESNSTDASSETLEEMVKRLQGLPFPNVNAEETTKEHAEDELDKPERQA